MRRFASPQHARRAWKGVTLNSGRGRRKTLPTGALRAALLAQARGRRHAASIRAPSQAQCDTVLHTTLCPDSSWPPGSSSAHRSGAPESGGPMHGRRPHRGVPRGLRASRPSPPGVARSPPRPTHSARLLPEGDAHAIPSEVRPTRAAHRGFAARRGAVRAARTRQRVRARNDVRPGRCRQLHPHRTRRRPHARTDEAAGMAPRRAGHAHRVRSRLDRAMVGPHARTVGVRGRVRPRPRRRRRPPTTSTALSASRWPHGAWSARCASPSDRRPH